MPPGDSLIGSQLSHFVLMEQIGAGGMGVVYLAKDQRLDRKVAIKLLPPGRLMSELARKRFRREALTLSRLNHPNIAAVYEFDSQNDVDFIAMEYVAGRTLADRLAVQDLRLEPALQVLFDVATGLKEAHDCGVLHGDLKPQNIVVNAKGQAKILDFGLAKIFRGDSGASTESMLRLGPAGTLFYAAPELLKGEIVDQRSDIWSFGVILYEVLAGRVPFQGKTQLEVMGQILSASPASMPVEVPPALAKIVSHCLKKVPSQRYRFMDEILAALSPELPAHDETRSTVEIHLRRPRPAGNALLLVAAIVLVLGIAAVMFRHSVRDWWSPVPRAPLAPRSKVLLCDFENRTGDPAFDNALGMLLTTGLEQSRYFDIVTPLQLSEALERMRLPANSRIDEKLGREICVRENLQAVVLGGIAKLGDEYLISLRAIEANGKALFSDTERAQGYPQVLASMDHLESRLRSRLGESTAAVRDSQPLERVTSSSLEAIQLFSTARKELHLGNRAEAEEFMLRAVAVDPQFAMAYAYLALIQLQNHHFHDGSANMKRAVALADRLTERERYKIIGDYHLKVTGNLNEAAAQYRALLDLYPDDFGAHNNLALTYEYQGRWDPAIQEAQKAVELWDGPLARNNLAYIFFQSGKTDRAIDIEKSILSTYPEFKQFGLYNLAIFTLAGDQPAEAEQYFLDAAQIRGPVAVRAELALADLHQSQGRYNAAADELQKAILICKGQRDAYAEAVVRLHLSRLLLERDRREDSLRETKQSATALEEPQLLAMAGVLLARLGETQTAEGLEKKISEEQASPWRIQIKAAILLAKRDFTKASSLLSSVAYPLRTPLLEMQAHAYAETGHPQQAIAAYEEVLRRKPERITDEQDEPCLYCVLFDQYQLGILYARTGQKAQGQRNLVQFLDHLRTPDPNTPHVEEARVELKRLH